jgi:hypothetical protein
MAWSCSMLDQRHPPLHQSWRSALCSFCDHFSVFIQLSVIQCHSCVVFLSADEMQRCDFVLFYRLAIESVQFLRHLITAGSLLSTVSVLHRQTDREEIRVCSLASGALAVSPFLQRTSAMRIARFFFFFFQAARTTRQGMVVLTHKEHTFQRQSWLACTAAQSTHESRHEAQQCSATLQETCPWFTRTHK